MNFLDSVVEAKKQEEAEKKRMVEEELDKFRRNRQETEAGKDLVEEKVEGGWGKRKRGVKKTRLAGLSKKTEEGEDDAEKVEDGEDRQKRVKSDDREKTSEGRRRSLRRRFHNQHPHRRAVWDS